MGERSPCLFCIGMAGTGKTSLVQRLNSELLSHDKVPYLVNLDPAVLELPYEPNIDIRDNLDYKVVMEKYGLGPNGAIMTSLNLFATKFDQVLDVLQERCEQVDNIIIDTPGQIEVFNWSASGSIILDTISALMPSAILYVVDTEKCCQNIAAFMSNMLYACSILFKTQLPLIVVFNKTDLCSAEEPIKWLRDYFYFQEAVFAEESKGSNVPYHLSLVQSMGLVLEEFYRNMEVVSVSSHTGEGFDDLRDAIKKAIDGGMAEFEERSKKYNQKVSNPPQEDKDKKEDLARLLNDLALDKQKDK